MATLLRPPLVFAPQRKLTFGFSEVVPRLITLDPVPKFLQLNDSAPRRKFQPCVDPPLRPLTLGINPNAAPLQLNESAPRCKFATQVDAYPNLSVTTLVPAGAVPLPLSAMRWDVSAPPSKRPVQVDQPMQRPIWLDPVPQVQRLSDSAPYRKFQPELDCYPNLSITTLTPAGQAIPLPLSAMRVDWAAPQAKRASVVEHLPPRPIWLDPIPRFQRLDQSAPWVKYRPQVDIYPNLLATTLKPATPYPLPLSAIRWDWVPGPRKFTPRVDIYPNLLTSTLTPPIPPILEVVPYLIEDVLSAALMRIASIYCVANVIGTTGSVTIQDPIAFTLVARGSTIAITLGGTIKGSGTRKAQAPYGSPDAMPPFPDPKLQRH